MSAASGRKEDDCPLVSVVIPTYNRAHWVTQAVESVLAQTYRPVEVIVVDDGSSDDPEAALAPCRDSVEVLRHSGNRGLSAARNTGIAAARGEYVAFLDTDDRWEPTKLQRQVAALRSRPDAGFCFCDFSLWQDDALLARSAIGRLARRAGEHPFDHLIERNFASACSLIIPAARFREAGTFDESLTACEDWDIALRLSYRWPVVYVDEPLLRVRWHRENMSADLVRMCSNGAAVLCKALRMLEETSDPRRRVLARKCACVLSQYGRDLFYAGQPEARTLLSESLGLHWWLPRSWRYLLATSLPGPAQELLRQHHRRHRAKRASPRTVTG